MLLAAPSLRAQSFALDWFSISGGGGTSSGGGYTMSGTIGQADAGEMSGGPYLLQGGFWSLTGAQTPGVPLVLEPNESYFRSAGGHPFVFMRNLTSWRLTDFDEILDLAKTGGTKLVRSQLIEGLGPGITSSGAVDEAWASQWEQVFDKAGSNGISVIPVFSSWFLWNDGQPDFGDAQWGANPLNQTNGGPAQTPGELFQDGPTQAAWLAWVQALVNRWQWRTNIIAWEAFSELNLASGASESAGLQLAQRAASVIRAADAWHRPVNTSLSDWSEWPSLLQSDAVDYVSVHPYPGDGNLDTAILEGVGQKLSQYHKPVLIGESGLSGMSLTQPTLATSARAPIGIGHAIWAAMVSGAMNGRALYWEDSYAIYFPAYGMPYLEKYASAELVAAQFVKDVDFGAFQPLAVALPTGSRIIGGAVGSSNRVIGWFRDASCVPPNWPVTPIPAGQTVTVTVPGSTFLWQVNFYDPGTGSIVASTNVTRNASSLFVSLPAFQDDISFQLYVPPVAAPQLSLTRSGNQVTVSWNNGPGFVLQTTGVLGPQAVWTSLGTANPQVVPITTARQFFRVVSH